MRSVWLGSLVCSLAVAGATTNDRPPVPELRAYSLVFGDGSAAVEVVRGLVGPEGHVAFDPATRKLLVVAAPDVQAHVARAVQELDRPPRNVHIEVRFRRREAEDQQAARVRGSGRIVIEPGGTRTTVRLQPHLEATSLEAAAETTQHLLVASGRQASIFVGEELPNLPWLLDDGVNHGLAAPPAWQQVGAYLLVEPWVVGGGPLIRVRLTPELSGRVEGHAHRLRFVHAATEVTLSDGASLSLAGLKEHREFYSRFLTGRNRQGGLYELDIVLTVRLAPTAMGPAGKP